MSLRTYYFDCITLSIKIGIDGAIAGFFAQDSGSGLSGLEKGKTGGVSSLRSNSDF